MSELIESLKKCRVEGNTLYLPADHLSNYAEVRKALMNAGASYKRNTFIFKSDAQPFVDRLTGGESVNIRKEFQFFPTPPDISDWLIELADINASHKILEPSAGDGSLIKAVDRKLAVRKRISCFELMPENRNILSKLGGVEILGDDFLKHKPTASFDRILANPPFNKNQDISHIRHMYECLKKGGRIVSIASKHWEISSGKKETEFKEWLESMDYISHDIEKGRFKESGTLISCCIVVIDK